MVLTFMYNGDEEEGMEVAATGKRCRELRGKDNAVHRAFDKLDLNGDGQLHRFEIAHCMQAAAKKIRLDMEPEVIDIAVDALMEDADSAVYKVSSAPYLTRDQFINIFRRHPDMLCAFDDDSTRASRIDSVFSRVWSQEEIIEEVEEEKVQLWEQAHARWRNRRVAMVWLVLYGAANFVAFTAVALRYAHNEDAIEVFGTSLIVARGCAQCLNLNCCLILLPMCRHLVTRMRAFSKLRFCFPFDATPEIHMLVGLVIAVFTLGHVAAHIFDFIHFASANEGDIIELLGTKLGTTIPSTPLGRWLLLLKQPAAITGIIMLVCMIIAYPTIIQKRKKFNTFWYTHHLLLIMLVCLCFHGMSSLLQPFQSVYWVGPPLLLYLIPRFFRETKCTSCEVLDVTVKGGNVIALRLAKPPSWNNSVQAGMYAFINIPKVSRFEWHPFTMTTAPYEDFIEFHFARAGDWTTKVHDILGGSGE